MKKWLTFVLSGLLVLTLAGCSRATSDTSGSTSQLNIDAKTTLIVYFSGSGNTRAVAKKIAKQTGGTLFEMEPQKAYSEDDLDYNNDDSRVSKEHNSTKLQNVKLKTTKVKNWSKYKTVFFGYPIWWQRAAWPVNDFVKNNDFSGKNVIAFCTSFSSGLGDSDTRLAKLAKTGNWVNGHGFSEDASSSDVKDWLSSIEK